jgi:lipid II:glycine glycyltransferase (peptidoglycan interpeptide bridge formation enzyme)
MLIRPIQPEERQAYNAAVNHPLQSWEWGEFRRLTGTIVERVGLFDGKKLLRGLQVFFHKLPITSYTAGYFPKGYMPDEEQLSILQQLAKKNRALFVKLEPNVAAPVGEATGHVKVAEFLEKHDAVAGRPLFTKYTFQLDLRKSEDALFAQLASKTRYNVNLAFKKGVQIIEDSSEHGMETYIDILQETTERQKFYAHTPAYFRTMWQALGQSGMMRIFHAMYENTVIVSWIMFVFNDVLYYPYGASRAVHRDVMASNLMMWEMMKYGREQHCHTFDMWGALGPDANEKDPWFGFHRFKKGYGGVLTEFLGTFDFVTQHQLYPIFRLAEQTRWRVLRLRKQIGL